MNTLSVTQYQSIITLSSRGWSARKIARELGVHRTTVAVRVHPNVTRVGRSGGRPDASWIVDSRPSEAEHLLSASSTYDIDLPNMRRSHRLRQLEPSALHL